MVNSSNAPTYTSQEQIFDIDIRNVVGDIKILKLMETASRSLGEVNNIVSNVFDFDFIVTALKNIEALNSARIEGTTGNLKDLYLEKALDFEKKKQLKLFSAVNYRTAMGELETIIKGHKNIDLPLVRHLHKLLTEDDPSTQGIPGKFREKDVKIKNSKLGDFYPAYHAKVPEFMERFAKELAQMTAYPDLLRVAFSHYQFEAIHPFEDGNGRTGRLLIVTDLLINGTLECAVLNLSQYFDSHRDEYIESLRSVSDDLNYEKWVMFFLKAIIEQCQHNITLIKMLRSLKEKNELTINENTKTPATAHVLNHSLNRLYITIPDTVNYLQSKRIKGDLEQIARNNIKKLVQLGILAKTSSKIVRADVYVHENLKKMLMSV